MIDSMHPERLTNDTFMSFNSPFRIFKQSLHVNIDVHWHEFYELGLIVSGEGTHTLNGHAYPLVPGSVFLLTPADFHQISPASGSLLQLYNMIFSNQLMQNELYQLLFSDNLVLQHCFTGNEFDSMEAEFSRIWQESQEWRIGNQIVIEGTLKRILIDLVRSCIAACPSVSIQEEPQPYKSIRQALIYIQHHFREPLTLEEAAKQVHLSANYFSECFHKALGISFQVHLQELRLQFAKSLLCVSELPITEICLASGFNTLPHFERSFKKKFEQSPRDYRKTFRIKSTL